MSYAGEFPSVTKTHMLTISRSCPVLACRAIAVRMLFILHPGKASTAERTIWTAKKTESSVAPSRVPTMRPTATRASMLLLSASRTRASAV